jgi:hypothetical protein
LVSGAARNSGSKPDVGYLLYTAEAAGNNIIGDFQVLASDPDHQFEAVEVLG